MNRKWIGMYKIKYTKVAKKHISNLKAEKLDKKTKALIEIVKANPYQNPPAYEKLVGNFKGLYSRRINHQHRLVYEVFESESEEDRIVKIVSMWTHYEF